MITTHVLDVARGQPAGGVTVILEMRHQRDWIPIGRGSTDANGRLMSLTEENHPLSTGTYRLTFDTGSYFREQGIASPFFPEVKILFNVDGAGDDNFHVPLLLSPYGYSTYRGT
jgi:5-hydroxyisourate hydrolase